MTIFKLKASVEKKHGKTSDDSPYVVTTEDVLPLTQSDGSHKVRVLRSDIHPCERQFMKVCSVAAVLCIMIFAAFLGYFVHHKLMNCKPVVQTLHVQFQEYERRSNQDDVNVAQSRIEGAFFEQVEIDWKTERYEKINIPPFIDVKSHSIIHDFHYNLTAVIDNDDSRCFLMALNLTAINPPRRFVESIDNMMAGHGFPVAKIERLFLKVVLPAVSRAVAVGELISSACGYFNTYRLATSEEASVMTKRSACDLAGNTYSLGETGNPIMLLVTLDGCV